MNDLSIQACLFWFLSCPVDSSLFTMVWLMSFPLKPAYHCLSNFLSIQTSSLRFHNFFFINSSLFTSVRLSFCKFKLVYHSIWINILSPQTFYYGFINILLTQTFYYGFINTLSTQASLLWTTPSRQKLRSYVSMMLLLMLYSTFEVLHASEFKMQL